MGGNPSKQLFCRASSTSEGCPMKVFWMEGYLTLLIASVMLDPRWTLRDQAEALTVLGFWVLLYCGTLVS